MKNRKANKWELGIDFLKGDGKERRKKNKTRFGCKKKY